MDPDQHIYAHYIKYWAFQQSEKNC